MKLTVEMIEKLKPLKQELKSIINQANQNEFKLYLVGGGVRDLLLNRQLKDFDIEVHGQSTKKVETFLQQIPKIKINNKFKVYKLIKSKSPITIEFSIPRKEYKNGKHRTDFILDFDATLNLKDAAKRRDFTINSLYLDLDSNVVYDPTGYGLKHLAAKKVEVINTTTFLEDELRVIRGVCFAARLDFRLGAKFINLIPQVDFKYLSVNKITSEFRKVEKEHKTVKLIKLLLQEQLLDKLGFEFSKMNNLLQNSKYHYEKDCLDHTIQAVELTKDFKDPILTWGALFHDYGKITATTFDGKTYHAKNHEEEGYQQLKNKLGTIFEKNDQKTSILKIIRYHMEIRNNAIKQKDFAVAVDLLKKLGDQDYKRLIIFSIIDLKARKNNHGKLPIDVEIELDTKIIQKYWHLIEITKQYIDENYSIPKLKIKYPNVTYIELKQMQLIKGNEHFRKNKNAAMRLSKEF